jgi:hypothetical protein
MCCPLDAKNTIFEGLTITETICDSNQHVEYVVEGIVNHSPQYIQEKAIRAFQNLELVEKAAEFSEQFFHLIQIPLKTYASRPIYEALHKLHHNAHEIEHFLHAACFLGDILCMLTCNYLQYQDADKTQLDYIRTGARVAHTTAHFFATAAYLSEYNICHFGYLERFLKFGSVLTVVGYALGTSAILWDRYRKNQQNDQFYSDLGIHLGGFVFEGLSIVKASKCLSSSTKFLAFLEVSTAIVGMIHSWYVIERLNPQRQHVRGTVSGIIRQNGHSHTHSHTCHSHDHS